MSKTRLVSFLLRLCAGHPDEPPSGRNAITGPCLRLRFVATDLMLSAAVAYLHRRKACCSAASLVMFGVCRVAPSRGHLPHTDGCVLSVRLEASSPAVAFVSRNSPDRPYAKAFPRVSSVRASWYDQRPEPIPRIALTPALQHRVEEYPSESWAPFFEWNLTYLREQACTSTRDVVMGNLRDFYHFKSLDGSRYPTYRHLRNISPPGWFVTNSFGWRGSDILLNKPPATIRIAFVGASTTIDAFGVPFSHPELVQNRLNWCGVRRSFPSSPIWSCITKERISSGQTRWSVSTIRGCTSSRR